ncbi:hypothetical protein [Ruegeria sp. HKCCA4812]|uniref:hypothetical protein n=1 Tax=Ruegeria sp. HKCCA4812 TaxID=2682993 RepID=UPI0014897A62|nr:hypothetical protein [Ruegeria sp. HKCCA4812]
MPDDDLPAHFDQEQRDRIREAVKAYMKAHSIGVPTLLSRVHNADPRRREISLPTMQRFVRGTHKTSEMVVGMSLQLLKTEGFAIPEPQDEVADPLIAFESGLVGFLLSSEADEGGEEIIHDFAGNYRRSEQKAPDAVVEILPSSNSQAFRISETRTQDMFTDHYSGVLIARENRLFGVLRNILTDEPRVYWLHYGKGLMPDDDSEMLTGEVRERPFLTAAALVDATDELTLTKQKAPSL